MNLPEGYVLKHKSHSAVLYADEEKIAAFPLAGANIGKIEEIISKIEKEAWRYYDIKILSVCQK